jgi:chemotaxis protein MotB
MRSKVVAVLGFTVVLSAVGCVPQEKYDDALNAYRSKEQQLHQANAEIETLRGNERLLRNQLQRADTDVARAIGQLGASDEEIARLRNDFEAMLATVSEFDVGPLPAQLNNALLRLASQHKDMLSYDERSGMLRFSSDLSFDLGSASLSSAAKQTLGQLAVILNSNEASSFEIRVVGHTDNVPIKRPSTRAKHPTNTHLAVHRAISVRDALVSDGVTPDRTLVAGYGQYRPIAPNGTRGAAANRRVEIYLFPMTETTATESTSPATTATATESEDPVK